MLTFTIDLIGEDLVDAALAAQAERALVAARILACLASGVPFLSAVLIDERLGQMFELALGALFLDSLPLCKFFQFTLQICVALSAHAAECCFRCACCLDLFSARLRCGHRSQCLLILEQLCHFDCGAHFRSNVCLAPPVHELLAIVAAGGARVCRRLQARLLYLLYRLVKRIHGLQLSHLFAILDVCFEHFVEYFEQVTSNRGERAWILLHVLQVLSRHVPRRRM